MSDYFTILQELGYQFSRNGSRYRAAALYRGGTNPNSISYDPVEEMYYDFGDESGGPASKLVKLTLGHDSDEETEQWLKGKISEDTREERLKRPIEQILDLERTYDDKDLERLIKDHEYWINRGIKREVVERFKGGVAKRGGLYLRYVFPIRNKAEKIIGFSGRSLYWKEGAKYAKWKHMGKIANWEFPTHMNSEKLSEASYIVVVESIGDCLAHFNAGYENVIVAFGLNLRPGVLKALLRYSPQKVVLSYNNDLNKEKNSGKKAAYKVRDKLLNYFDKDQLSVVFPDANDFGDMDAEQITGWHERLFT